jgi:hypothetical protein
MEDINYNFIDNIISYKIIDSVKKELDYKTEKIDSNLEKKQYFILEWCSDNSNAFAHWVYECCVYIPYYLELKKKYPLLKLYMTNKKKFKDIFLEYLGVDLNDVVYSLELPNTCIFHDFVCLGHQEVTEEYKNILDNFLSYFPKKYEKDTDILLMPRQVKENYIGNDRVYNTRDHEELILGIDDNNKVLHTDTIENLEEQIKIVQSSKTVVVTDGSPAAVNILFAKDSEIIILNDNNHLKDQLKYQYLYKYVIEKIIEKNKLNVKYTKDISVYSLIEIFKEGVM